ncbi:MAG: hypothetical protein U5L11_12160 [Arhodomonas sp.]|nr:hypothetical protein [Arhodomonas sp.]
MSTSKRPRSLWSLRPALSRRSGSTRGTQTIKALAQSDTLERRLQGEATFDALAREWRTAEAILQGYFFVYYGLRDGTIEYYPEGELPEGYDPRERPWYEAGMRVEREPAWTAPYEEATSPAKWWSAPCGPSTRTARKSGSFRPISSSRD